MINLAKELVFLGSMILALPFIILSVAGSGFRGCSQTLSLIPGWFGKQLRKPFYHLLLDSASRHCHIDFGTIFPSRKVFIGKNVYIGAYCIIAESIIGDDVLIGSGVHLLSNGTHDFSRLDMPIRMQGGKPEPITIGEDSWIGNNAIVMADVGKKCVIGAGSVVTSAIPDYAIAVGNPAKVIKFRNQTPDKTPAEG